MSRPDKVHLPYRKNVGIMVINREGKVWMGHRPVRSGGDEISATDKRWQMPQGGIDKGEEPLEAARRELWEETGIKSATLLGKTRGWITYDLPDELIGIGLKGKFRGQKQKWFAFRFDGKDSEINISEPPDGAPVEFDQWEWMEMDKLPEVVVDFKRDVYEQVIAEFRQYAMT